MSVWTRSLAIGLFLSWVQGASAANGASTAKASPHTVPKTWDDALLATLEIPVASLGAGKKKHVPSEYYYRVPIRPVYKTYPVYAPGRDPKGYKEWLKKQEPKIV